MIKGKWKGGGVTEERKRECDNERRENHLGEARSRKEKKVLIFFLVRGKLKNNDDEEEEEEQEQKRVVRDERKIEEV